MENLYKIGVIGSGAMGNGIAHVSAQSGFKTTLIDINQTQLDKALSLIGKNLDRQIKKYIITSNDKKDTLLNISSSTITVLEIGSYLFTAKRLIKNSSFL